MYSISSLDYLWLGIQLPRTIQVEAEKTNSFAVTEKIHSSLFSQATPTTYP
jgi:hypothetical protein